jgi:O-antigen ligase
MPHPNILAAFLILGLIIGFYLVSRETLGNNPPKDSPLNQRGVLWIVSCGTIVIVLGLFFTFSRMAWFGGLIAGGAFLLFHVKHKNYKAIKMILVIGLVSCGTIGLFYSKLLTSRVGELTSQSDSVILRESFNSMGIKLFQTHPVLGVGIGNYIPAMQSMFNLQDWQYQPAHNMFIFITAEMGILGFIGFLGLICLGLRFTWNKSNNLIGFTLLIVFVVYLIVGNFDHYFVTIQQGRLMFFMVLGLCLALTNLKPELS